MVMMEFFCICGTTMIFIAALLMLIRVFEKFSEGEVIEEPQPKQEWIDAMDLVGGEIRKNGIEVQQESIDRTEQEQLTNGH